jgi:PAS domain S-box-containing protein
MNEDRKLPESMELFTNLFEYNPASLAISRVSDGKLVNVNKSFLLLFGFSTKEEVIGKSAAELNIRVDPKQRDEMMRLLRENNRVLNWEAQIRIPKGDLKWASSSVLSIEVEGHPCLLAVTLDITGLKRAEEQLQSINKELEGFSYSVSHDLRAPLRSLVGYSKILQEDHGGQLDDEGRRVLDVIHHNALKMNNLIDNLLEFSRLGRKELERSEIDNEKLLRHILTEMVQHRADIRLNPLPPTVGDSALLRQVWFNLVSNAIKYSAKKAKPVIEIGSDKTETETVYYVRDNGVGFDMEYSNKLFGVFQRLHKAAEFEGTGVGLALVKRIVTRHGGRVWAEGKVNEGATFYFSMPT